MSGNPLYILGVRIAKCVINLLAVMTSCLLPGSVILNMADKKDHEKKSSPMQENPPRKRFFKTEPIPRLSHNDPLANELISQEVGFIT